jgi:hypothetical protein
VVGLIQYGDVAADSIFQVSTLGSTGALLQRPTNAFVSSSLGTGTNQDHRNEHRSLFALLNKSRLTFELTGRGVELFLVAPQFGNVVFVVQF